MNRRQGLLAALGWSAAACTTPAQAQTPPPPSPPPPQIGELKPLGQDRFQLGRIVVDKSAHSFTLPGRVKVLGQPLEYLATSPRGRKAYEALLELDASGSEFNLACILIGLERDPDLPPWKPPGQANPVGRRVFLSVAWSAGGQRHQITAAEALFDAEARAKVETVEWAYTGSFTSLDGSRFAADQTGTLISFIKDPTGIIQLASSIGLGAYGAVRGSTVLPPVGSAIELIVEAAATPK